MTGCGRHQWRALSARRFPVGFLRRHCSHGHSVHMSQVTGSFVDITSQSAGLICPTTYKGNVPVYINGS